MKDRRAIQVMMIAAMFFAIPSCVSAESRKIGVVLPLSGPMSVVGEAIRRGIEIFQAQQNGIEVLFEDDQYMPRNTVLAVQRLIDNAHVAGLIVFGSGPSLSVVDIVEKRKVPMISIAMNDTIAAGRKHVFRIFMTSETQNKAICDEVRRRNYQRIAIVLTTSDAVIPLRDRFIEYHPDRVVLVRDVLPGETDLRSIALRVHDAKPEAVYILLLQSQIGPFAQQLRDIGYQGDFFGGVQSCSTHEIRSARGALEGGWCASFEDSRAGAFYAEYKQQFGEEALPESLLGYEAAHIYSEGGKAEMEDFLQPGRIIEGGILGRFVLAPSHTFEIGASIKRIIGDNPVTGQQDLSAG